MNIGYLIEKIENFQLSEEVFYLLGERFALSQIDRVVIIAALVVGFLWCFFGLHGIRIWSAILGLVIGILVFSRVAALFVQDDLIVLIVAAVLGLVLAIISARFYLFGAFLYAFVVTGGLALYWLNPQNTMLLAVCVIIALLAAVLVLKQPNIIVILVSAVAGGVVGIAYLRNFVYLSDLLGVVFTLVLIILGALIQFILLSGREKRKQLARAAEIRLQQAIASEVEKARNFLDELDDKGKEKKTPKNTKEEKSEVKEEKPKVREAQESREQTEQTEQEIVQRLKDELMQNLGEESVEIAETKSDSTSAPESEQNEEVELESKAMYTLESVTEVELVREFEKEAEKIEIDKGIPEDDFAGLLDLGRVARPVDEGGFSEIDEVGEIDI